MAWYDKANPKNWGKEGKDKISGWFKEIEKKTKSELSRHSNWWKKKIEDGAKKLIGQIESTGKKAVGEVEKGGKKAVGEIDHAGKQVLGEIDEAMLLLGKEVEKIPGHIEEGFEEGFRLLAEAVSRKGLKLVRNTLRSTDEKLTELKQSKPGLVAAMDNMGGYIEIGPLTLKYDGFYTRLADIADVLDHYVNEPPKLRRGPILQMVAALGPTTIDTGISVQVVALVVGSKELGVGGGLDDISIELFVEIGDVILEKMGVPE